MKKTLCGILCAALMCAAVAGTAACSAPNAGDPTMEFAGSLQTLYGGGGYPQAVLVVKNSVIGEDPAAVAAMTAYMEGADEYLTSAQPSDIVSLLQSHYAAGLTPQFNANNLSRGVIENCSVGFTPAAQAKDKVDAFLSELIGIDGSFTSAVAQSFYYEGGAASGTVSGSHSVYAPDGAPALALANAISQTTGNGFSYNIVAASTVNTYVTGASPTADFCILPVNLAAKALGQGTVYKMLGVVTSGNMYLLRAKKGLAAIGSADDLEKLVGKKVGVVQLNNVPGLTLQAVLQRAGVAYQIIDSSAEPAPDKVNLIAFADATTVGPAAGCDYYLCPEPAATAKVNAFKNQTK